MGTESQPLGTRNIHPQQKHLAKTWPTLSSFQMMRAVDGVESQNLFPRVAMPKTRGHSFKVRGPTFKGDVRGREVYTQRIVCAWNGLLRVVMEADDCGV